jgi:hypothetical protein
VDRALADEKRPVASIRSEATLPPPIAVDPTGAMVAGVVPVGLAAPMDQ